MCKRIAKLVTGIQKPTYRRGAKYKGDKCIVVNAEKIQLRGRELKYRKIKYHTGHPGGLIEIPFVNVLERKPEFLIYHGVHKKMNADKIRERIMKKFLYVYSGPEVKYKNFLPNVI